MTPPSAAPPGPQRKATVAWLQAYAAVSKEAEGWAKRLAEGQPPLKAGEAARLQSLVTSLQAMKPMSTPQAQVTAQAMGYINKAGGQSLQAAIDALPKHIVDSVVADAAAIGWTSIPNQAAIAQVVNGGVGALTGDFAKMTVQVQADLIDALTLSLFTGESPKVAAKRFQEALGPVFGQGQYRSVMIARTTMARAYDQASIATYTQAANEGILYGWRWVARPGACDVCRTLHGTIFPAQVDTYRHPNCTCVTVPVLSDEAAAKLGYGQRYQPYEGTKVNDLELKTSKNGWSSWTLNSGKKADGVMGPKKVAAKSLNPAQQAAKQSVTDKANGVMPPTVQPKVLNPKPVSETNALYEQAVKAADAIPSPEGTVLKGLHDGFLSTDGYTVDYKKVGTTQMWRYKAPNNDPMYAIKSYDGTEYVKFDGRWKYAETGKAVDELPADGMNFAIEQAFPKAAAKATPAPTGPVTNWVDAQVKNPDDWAVGVAKSGAKAWIEKGGGKILAEYDGKPYFFNSIKGKWTTYDNQDVSPSIEKKLKDATFAAQKSMVNAAKPYKDVTPAESSLSDFLDAEAAKQKPVSSIPTDKWVYQQMQGAKTAIDPAEWEFGYANGAKVWKNTSESGGKAILAEYNGKAYYWNHVEGKWWSLADGNPPAAVKKALDAALKEAKPIISGPKPVAKPAAKLPETAEVKSYNDSMTSAGLTTDYGKAGGYDVWIHKSGGKNLYVSVEKDGKAYYFEYATDKWTDMKTGKNVPYSVQDELTDAVNTVSLKAKPASPDVTPGGPIETASGTANGTTVTKVGDKVTGSYKGDSFTWNGDNWIHDPTNSGAGPNSTKALNQAAQAGNVKLPGVEKPDWVTPVARPSKHTKADLARGYESKMAEDLKSPYPDVSDAEWRKAWDDAADGKQLPESILSKPDAKQVVDLIQRYTSNYSKGWVGNPAAEKWFENAPKYASITYRGMSMGSRKAAWKYVQDQAQIGQIMDTDGGWSHSFDRRVAAGRFGGEGRDGSILIEVRGGTSGLPVEGFTRVQREQEILVWSKLKVLEVNETPKGIHIIVEEVGKFDGRGRSRPGR